MELGCGPSLPIVRDPCPTTVAAAHPVGPPRSTRTSRAAVLDTLSQIHAKNHFGVAAPPRMTVCAAAAMSSILPTPLPWSQLPLRPREGVAGRARTLWMAWRGIAQAVSAWPRRCGAPPTDSTGSAHGSCRSALEHCAWRLRCCWSAIRTRMSAMAWKRFFSATSSPTRPIQPSGIVELWS